MCPSTAPFKKPALSPGTLPSPNWGGRLRAAPVDRETIKALQVEEARVASRMDSLAAKLGVLGLPVYRDASFGGQRHHIVVTAGESSRRPFLIFDASPERTVSFKLDAPRLQAGVRAGDEAWAFDLARSFCAHMADWVSIQIEGPESKKVAAELGGHQKDLRLAKKVLGG